MCRFRNYARLHIGLLPVVEHRWSLAKAIQDAFIGIRQRSAPDVGSVAIGAGRNQVSGSALPALDAMADEGHLERCLLGRRWRTTKVDRFRRKGWTFSDTSSCLIDAFGLNLRSDTGGSLAKELT